MRRNEIEYPAYPDDVLDRSEAAEAVDSASALITAAEKLLPNLALFG